MHSELHVPEIIEIFIFPHVQMCVNNHIRNRKGEFVKELAKLQSSMEGSSKRIEKLKQI